MAALEARSNSLETLTAPTSAQAQAELVTGRQPDISTLRPPAHIFIPPTPERLAFLAPVQNQTDIQPFAPLLSLGAHPSRRELLKILGIGSVLGTAAFIAKQIGVKLFPPPLQERCYDAYAWGVSFPEPVPQTAYETKTLREKAKYLLSGGYVQDWTEDGVPSFVVRGQLEAVQVIPKAICAASGVCDPTVLARQIILPATGDAFKQMYAQLIMEGTVPTPQDSLKAEARYKEVWGLTGIFDVDPVGTQLEVRRLMNLEPLAVPGQARFQDEFGNPNYHVLMGQMADTIAHEIQHAPGVGLYSPAEMGEMTQLWQGKIVDADEITFVGSNEYLLFFVDKAAEIQHIEFKKYMSESMRSLRQQVIDDRLGLPPSLFEDDYYYGGSRLIKYLNDALGITDDEFYLVTEAVAKGNLWNTTEPRVNGFPLKFNMLDLFKYYRGRAVKAGFARTSLSDIADLFIAIDSAMYSMKEKTTQDMSLYDRGCALDDVYQEVRRQISKRLTDLK